jgi:hypothetical protein
MMWSRWDSDIFNQLDRMLRARRGVRVMRCVDRISGSFVVVIAAGLALLCGSLLAMALG